MFKNTKALLTGNAMKATLSGIAMLGLLSSSLAAQGATPDVESAKAAVIARDYEWQTVALEKKDAKKIASYFSPDVISYGSGGPTTKGMDGVTKLAEAFVAGTATAYRVTWDRVDISSSGDMAYFYGMGKETTTDAGGKRVTSTARFVRIWKKGADGVWLCTMEIWTT